MGVFWFTQQDRAKRPLRGRQLIHSRPSGVTYQELDEWWSRGDYQETIAFLTAKLQGKHDVPLAGAADGRLPENQYLLRQLADACACHGSFAEAIQLYEELVQVQDSGDSQDELLMVDTRIAHASAVLQSGNPAQALDELDWCESLVRFRGDAEARGLLATLWHVMADGLCVSGRFAEAECLLRESAELFAELHPQPTQSPLDRLDAFSARYRLQLGKIRAAEGRHFEALPDLQRASGLYLDWLGLQHPESARVVIYAMNSALEVFDETPETVDMTRAAWRVLHTRLRFDHPDLLLADTLLVRLFGSGYVN